MYTVLVKATFEHSCVAGRTRRLVHREGLCLTCAGEGEGKWKMIKKAERGIERSQDMMASGQRSAGQDVKVMPFSMRWFLSAGAQVIGFDYCRRKDH